MDGTLENSVVCPEEVKEGRVGRNAFGSRLGNHTQSCGSGTRKVAVKIPPGVQGE